MASVRLNGDTSGFIEISAPNVAGSTTITLPATSGGNFLVTDSNGDLNVDSGTLFVDASTDRVGIGETSPSTSLHITGANTAARGQLSLEGTSADARLTFYRDTDFIGHVSGNSDHLNIATENGHHIEFSPQGAEAVRIDTSGRLLIGTFTAGPTAGEQLTIADSSNAGITIRSGTTAAGSILFEDDTADRGEIQYSHTDDFMRFKTAGTERMRIRNDGDTAVFTTRTDGTCFQADSSGTANTQTICFAGKHSSTGTFNGTLSFKVTSNGDVQNTNNSYDALSDNKLKENIVDAGSQWSDIKSLRVRNYNFKEETGHQTHTQIGLIAQELELTSPGLVTSSLDLDEEGNDLGTVTRGVKYSVVYMKAVKALQEAMERIETLETTNASLEARLTALEGGN